MMSTVHITLPSELQRRAKKRADELGLSFSELTRRALEEAIAQEPGHAADISAIFGILGSGEPSDIAERKDEYIGEAFEHEYLRKIGRPSKDEIGPPKAD